jgi:hypothetical protein
LPSDDLEIKEEKVIAMMTEGSSLSNLLHRYSFWSVLERKVAILTKFCDYSRIRFGRDKQAKPLDCKISVEDLRRTEVAVIKLVQASTFSG